MISAITNFARLMEQNIREQMKCDEKKCGLIVGGVCINHQVELALKAAAKVVSKLIKWLIEPTK